jgi:hypothetical protein
LFTGGAEYQKAMEIVEEIIDFKPPYGETGANIVKSHLLEILKVKAEILRDSGDNKGVIDTLKELIRVGESIVGRISQFDKERIDDAKKQLKQIDKNR